MKKMKMPMMDAENPKEEYAAGEEMDSMEVDSAAKTLMDAEHIKSNKSLYKAALAKVKGHHANAGAVIGKMKPKVTSVEGLRKAANEAED